MRTIKFRRAHFFDEEKTKFSHLSYWGVNIGYAAFISPSTNNTSLYHNDEQFTGLQDKNGVDIYEGDIYKYKSSEQGKQSEFYETTKVVHFNNGSYGFQEWHTDENKNLKERLYCHPAHFNVPKIYYIEFDLEVIGNIHENKDLS